ncbi:class I adenylate-forming enzyme family protein [Virgibacillus natechei]|uniref:class I adenylate-forming enzyme family protein n=1 Tax=Virgibacillus sp. CBA3643 TaxID=2942278 RepID=UPI0035A3659E
MVDTEVRVVNRHGEDVAPNGMEIGEIIVKGNGFTESEKETNQDGWLYTGDMGTKDEQGHITIVEHKNDPINNNENNISSLEVERVLYEHTAVKEVAVIVSPHEELGEISHAFVVLQAKSSVTEQELIAFTRGKLDSFKCPQTVTFMEELPKTVSGKILKVKLKDMN